MAKRKKIFQMPEQILRSIDECSGGGYLLFRFNELGEIDVNGSFDAPPYAMACQSFLKSWVDASHEINKISIMQNMVKPKR